MKNFKHVLLAALLLLFISLACQAVQPRIPTLEPIDTEPPLDFPTLDVPTEEIPTLEPLATKKVPPSGKYPSRIVYSLFASDGVYINAVDADGQNDVRLTENDCIGALPVWSNDGSLIAYYCFDTQQEKSNLWVMNQDGSDAHFVVELPDLVLFEWSPDNQHIVYHAPQSDGSENDIYVLDIASGDITDITEDSPVWDAFPDWSPNSDVIVFTSDRAPEGKAFDDVWTMNSDGSNLVNLTNNGTNWEDYHPSWSPDGNKIAFFRSGDLFGENVEGGPGGLWVMDADGQNQQLVVALDMFRALGSAVWSPDGQSLAYAAGLDEAQDVWVVPVAGGDPVNVSNMTGKKTHISWSPDSQTLIFTNNDDAADTLLIYIALPDGSDTHPLLDSDRYAYGDWAP